VARWTDFRSTQTGTRKQKYQGETFNKKDVKHLGARTDPTGNKYIYMIIFCWYTWEDYLRGRGKENSREWIILNSLHLCTKMIR
jgi:hypothetical protein